MTTILDQISFFHFGNTSIRSPVGLVVCLIVFYTCVHLRRRRQHQVRPSPGSSTWIMKLMYTLQHERLVSERYGCQPMRSRLPCKWPLGLDVLHEQWKANADKRLLAFQQPFLDKLGPNLEIKILGSIGYTTFDPENIEAALSTRFEGTSMLLVAWIKRTITHRSSRL